MKIKLLLAAAGIGCATALAAATLGVSTAVQSQPDPSSPVIKVLGAGEEQPAPSQKAGPTPPGWIAIDVAGPFVGYVRNKDLSKQLEVVPGASVFESPKDGSGVLTVFAKGDKAEITGLHGSWTQVRLDKTLVGYISANPAAAAPEPAPVSAPPPPVSAAPMPLVAPPAPPNPVALSQLFEGKLSSSHNLLSLRRPYKWQLNDSSGKLIAYVDLSRLLLTDQIENYAGHTVVVLGSLRPVKETGDLVIDVEAFHLK